MALCPEDGHKRAVHEEEERGTRGRRLHCFGSLYCSQPAEAAESKSCDLHATTFPSILVWYSRDEPDS